MNKKNEIIFIEALFIKTNEITILIIQIFQQAF